jgi:hypothetical protein
MLPVSLSVGMCLVMSKNQTRARGCARMEVLMPRIVRILALTSSVLALAAFAAAQTPSNTTATKTAASGTTKPAKAAAAHTSLVTVGKLAKYDAPTSMLTVTTATGDVMFTVSPTTKIQEGSKPLGAANLAADAGRNVRVSYSEKNGTKTVESIRVTPAATPKAAKAKK